MLQFIIGRSGSGKTSYLINQIRRAVESVQASPILFLVPEQQSFEMEKTMLNLLGPKDCRKVEVLSFSRLTDFVFRRRGGLGGRAVDDGVRSILMSLAIEQAQDQLTLYRRQAGRPELIPLMLNAVKEFKMCAVTTDMLRQAAIQSDDTVLRQKLTETALISDIYNALLSESYIDPLDDLTRLYESVLNTPFFTGFRIFADGFSGFTAQEQKIIGLMIAQSEEFTIALSGDEAEFSSKNDLFFTTGRTKRILKDIAKAQNIKILPDINLLGAKRFLSHDIAFLEENIYRPGPPPGHEKASDGISLYIAGDVYEESDHICRTIRRLTTEKNYRYGDIAVICRTLDSYRGILDTILEQYGISYFMDKPQEITSKPLIRFVLSAFDCVHTYFSSESVFRLLKTGLCGLSPEEVATLENYAFVWNISGGRWTSEFTQNPRGYADEFTKSDEEELKEAERLRSFVIKPLMDFKEQIANSDGSHISKAVYRLLQTFHVSRNLQAQAEKLREKGNAALAQEQQRLWDIFIGILDQMEQLLGKKRLPSKRYCELLKLVLKNAEISFIPNSLDEVTIGTADRIRLSSPKAVFVIGANEGEFPHLPVSGGIFSDAERRRLISMSLPLYDAVEELGAQEKFLAYCAVSAPREKIFLSCVENDLKGEAKAPSSLFREALRLFPQINAVSSRDIPWCDKLWAEKPAFELCAEHFTDDMTAKELLDKYFLPIDAYAAKIGALKRSHNEDPFAIRQKNISETLFHKEKLRLSASQVEKFYQCPFQYFCRYGVRAQERKPAQIDSAEYGSLIHFLMERLLRSGSIPQLASLSGQELEQRLDGLTEEYLDTHFGGAQDKSKRYLSMLRRMKSSALMLIEHMLKELSQSDFLPEAFELHLGEQGGVPPYEITLADGGRVVIEGYIDRVDVMRREEAAYIRVVDYKTGVKKFVLSDIDFGLNLQMLIYLYAITQKDGQKTVPAGVLYMPAASPMINADQDESAQSIDKKRAKAYRMNGVMLDDIDVIKGMEADGKGIYIPVSLKEEKPKKGGTRDPETPVTLKVDKGGEYLVSRRELDMVFHRIDELITGMAQRLFSGEIPAMPAKGTYDACKWCPYTFACGYEDGMACVKVTEDKTAFHIQEEPEDKGREGS